MRRGQAFEVFRLLIAAVVAGAILMVLLNILGNVGIRTQDPQDFTNQAVQSLVGSGGIRTSSVITFEKGQAIDLAAAARSATLEPGCIQGCVDSGLSSNFSVGSSGGVGEGVIQYTNSVKKKAKIFVRCGDPTTVSGVCSGSASTCGDGDSCPNFSNCSIACVVKIIKP